MEALPALVPPPTGPGVDPAVLLTAVAKAAAELAAREYGKRAELEPVTRAVVEDIAETVARKVVKEVLGELDIDLSSSDSKRAFREDIAHVRRGRQWWDKAQATLFTVVMTAIATGLVAAVVKFISIGGGK